MGLFGKKKKTQSSDSRTRGMRITEGLLPIFGPAQVGDSTAPVRPVTDAEAARSAEVENNLERRVAPNGEVYYVARSK